MPKSMATRTDKYSVTSSSEERALRQAQDKPSREVYSICNSYLLKSPCNPSLENFAFFMKLSSGSMV